MQTIDWVQTALDSEIEFSKAYKSQPRVYSNFIHLYNQSVPWGGDFNRAVGVRLTDFDSFDQIVAQVEQIHKDKGLDRPSRYDLYPPALDEGLWRDYLAQRGYRLETAVFFYSPAADEVLVSEFALYTPSWDEYLEWYCSLAKSRGYYDEQRFQMVKSLQENFVRVFKPYWLLKNDEMVGWVYCANLGKYTRLFDVGVRPEFRGQGLGKTLLQAIKIESGRQGAQFVLLQAGERLRQFYEKSGFRECSKNSIIWLK